MANVKSVTPELGGERSSSDARAASGQARAATDDARLVVDGLRKSFAAPAGGRLEVLRGVSLAARAGEALAIVGASGAGKSTLLHIIGGLDAADAGDVRAFGFDVTRAGVSQLVEWRGRAVGFVFQFHHVINALTAAENVQLPLLVARRDRREAREAALRALDVVGLASRGSHLPGELSGGEQQRVAIARALVAAPRLVLADEPTGNLDAATGDSVGELLLHVARERGACVVVATHNERLARLCDRVLVLEGGRLREDTS